MKVYVLTMTSQLAKATSRVARCWGCIAHAKKQSKPTWKQYLPNPESLPIFTTNLTWKRLMLAS